MIVVNVNCKLKQQNHLERSAADIDQDKPMGKITLSDDHYSSTFKYIEKGNRFKLLSSHPNRSRNPNPICPLPSCWPVSPAVASVSVSSGCQQVSGKTLYSTDASKKQFVHLSEYLLVFYIALSQR